MVNIIAMRQEERRRKITEIRESIKKAGKDVREEDIVMATMSNLGLARRTAQEYVKIALWEIAHGK